MFYYVYVARVVAPRSHYVIICISSAKCQNASAPDKRMAGGSRMLSEKRVAHMTKMAMLEDRYGRKLVRHCGIANAIIWICVH